MKRDILILHFSFSSLLCACVCVKGNPVKENESKENAVQRSFPTLIAILDLIFAKFVLATAAARIL